MTGGSDLPEAAIFRKTSGVSDLTGSIFFASSAMEAQPFRLASKSPIQLIPPREHRDNLADDAGKLEYLRNQPFRFEWLIPPVIQEGYIPAMSQELDATANCLRSGATSASAHLE
jgi:hypothetical protein